MRKTMIFVLAALLCGLSLGTSFSQDTVSLWGKYDPGGQIVYTNTNKGISDKAIEVGHFDIGNVGFTTSDGFAFCAQSGKNVSANFANKGVGESFYKAEFFQNTQVGEYSAAQQNFLKDMLSHVYPLAYNIDGSFVGTDFAKVVDCAMQLAIWEVNQEKTAMAPGVGKYLDIDLDITDGTYFVSKTKNTDDNSDFGSLLALTNEFLNAANGLLSWAKVGEAIGAAGEFALSTKDLTAFYYYSENNTSQAILQIGYTSVPSEVTPEPATAAILGLGLIGAGFFARRRRK